MKTLVRSSIPGPVQSAALNILPAPRPTGTPVTVGSCRTPPLTPGWFLTPAAPCARRSCDLAVDTPVCCSVTLVPVPRVQRWWPSPVCVAKLSPSPVAVATSHGPASSSVGSCWPVNSTPVLSPVTQSVAPAPGSACRDACVDARLQRGPVPAPAGAVSRCAALLSPVGTTPVRRRVTTAPALRVLAPSADPVPAGRTVSWVLLRPGPVHCSQTLSPPCLCPESSLPCTEEVPPCGDTCDRRLSCLKHTCSMRCHRGSCETCRQVSLRPGTGALVPPPWYRRSGTAALTGSVSLQEVEKECRCGKYRKQMACHKEYLCDSKCPRTRNCQRHQCRRKGAATRAQRRWRSGAPAAPRFWWFPAAERGAPSPPAARSPAGAPPPATTGPGTPTAATRVPAPPAGSPACCRCPAAPTPAPSPATTWFWSGPSRSSWPARGSSRQNRPS
uniref:Uncharacterized protein n=1 Tax=Fundulus heteroclitus TaxID=8078 RepID=A0A3Q2NMT5_FUNHE